MKGSREGVLELLPTKLEIASKHYQGPFDNTLQRLKSEKHGKSEMKGTIMSRRN